MAYYRDLTKISIDDYKKILHSGDLLPSWQVLKEDIDKNMDIIKQQKIQNLEELKTALKDKAKVEIFSEQSGLSIDYLMVLRRVINGYHPKPNRIKDFPGTPTDIPTKLEALGLKNTVQLYNEVLTPAKRKELSLKTGIKEEDIMRLARLTDLSRIKWVNHTFAYVLMEAGYDSAGSVADADYKKMYTSIKQLNREKEIYKGNIGANDMKRCVEAAQDLELDVEY